MPQAAGVLCDFQRPNQQDVDFWPPCSRHSRQGDAVQLSWAEVSTGYQEFDPLRGFQSVQSRRRVRKRSNVISPVPQYRCDFVSEARFVVDDQYARWYRDTLSPQQRERRLLCQTIMVAVSICDKKGRRGLRCVSAGSTGCADTRSRVAVEPRPVAGWQRHCAVDLNHAVLAGVAPSILAQAPG
jgi:hypothetical protein